MTRTIANAWLVATLAFAAPAYSSDDAFVKLKGVEGVVTNSTPATPGNGVKQNAMPKSAALLLPAIQKAQEAPKLAAKKPRVAAGDINGISTGNSKRKGNVDYGWKVESGEE